ncbi:SGNH/GDSL hydrolase family protein [Pedobacter nyackensis]|uniref:Lysophospholipase L1 n=1 Tax=Pedobacter nyackensis TaxID=475255 RepID=A0A1W1ZYZ5_9SPHI|nr:SGNH/GDSL hydrolase family protein [Pedobacter nyackensis]SMC53665.1 Lysophospholipase L1 [Pedobacter nyackensis]
MKLKSKFVSVFGFMFMMSALVCNLTAMAQNNMEKETLERERLIAASQTGAMPLFFDPAKPDVPTISPGNFNNNQECYLRGGLPNFFNKAKNKQDLVVGYIGGSITRGSNLYRMQSAKFIQNMLPGVKLKFINAGISGTGTDLGACRIQEQVLQYKPDLIFIEFAVNNAFPDGMEGMIRQIWKANPVTDIFMIYTIFNGQTQIYASGKTPLNIIGLEKIADHYQIPSVHMGLEASLLERDQKLLWKAPVGTETDKIIFSNDGTHPIVAGGNLYAQSIARSLLKMKDHAKEMKHLLPQPLLANNWEDAKMLAPLEVVKFSKGWTSIDPKTLREFKQFSDWFPYVMKAEEPGESFTFKFNGSMIGFFDIGGSEVGQLILEIDGKQTSFQKQKGTLALKANQVTNSSDPINRFNSFCNNRYRGQAEFIELPAGVHTVKFSISPNLADKKAILGPNQLEDITNNPDKYDKTAIYIGKILIRGALIN